MIGHWEVTEERYECCRLCGNTVSTPSPASSKQSPNMRRNSYPLLGTHNISINQICGEAVTSQCAMQCDRMPFSTCASVSEPLCAPSSTGIALPTPSVSCWGSGVSLLGLALPLEEESCLGLPSSLDRLLIWLLALSSWRVKSATFADSVSFSSFVFWDWALMMSLSLCRLAATFFNTCQAYSQAHEAFQFVLPKARSMLAGRCSHFSR